MSKKIPHAGDIESPNLRFGHFKVIIGYVRKYKPKQINSVSYNTIPLLRNAGSQPFKQYSLYLSKDLTLLLSHKYYKKFTFWAQISVLFILLPQ